MLEMLKKYQTLLSLVNVKSLTGDKLSSVLQMAGFNLDENVVEIVVDMIKGAGEQRNLTSIPQILADPAISAELVNLLSAVPSASEGSGEKQAVNEGVHLDSLIMCTHCKRRVHLRTAIKAMKDAKE